MPAVILFKVDFSLYKRFDQEKSKQGHFQLAREDLILEQKLLWVAKPVLNDQIIKPY